jgi:hypothetical protein
MLGVVKDAVLISHPYRELANHITVDNAVTGRSVSGLTVLIFLVAAFITVVFISLFLQKN